MTSRLKWMVKKIRRLFVISHLWTIPITSEIHIWQREYVCKWEVAARFKNKKIVSISFETRQSTISESGRESRKKYQFNSKPLSTLMNKGWRLLPWSIILKLTYLTLYFHAKYFFRLPHTFLRPHVGGRTTATMLYCT
jgi:hypothetical protein